MQIFVPVKKNTNKNGERNQINAGNKFADADEVEDLKEFRMKNEVPDEEKE